MDAKGRGGAGSAEQRQWPRLSAAGTVTARVMGSGEPGQGQMLDLSPHGLALRPGQALERGSVLEVRFDPSDGGHSIQAYAEVAWAQPGRSAGLRFIGMSQEEEERLQALVSSL